MPEFQNKPLQYFPSQVKPEMQHIDNVKQLRGLAPYNKHLIAQLMKRNAERYCKPLNEQIQNQKAIIETQAKEIKRLKAELYQKSII